MMWFFFVIIAATFFVLGQILLRKDSQQKTSEPFLVILERTCYFACSSGFLAFLLLMILWSVLFFTTNTITNTNTNTTSNSKNMTTNKGDHNLGFLVIQRSTISATPWFPILAGILFFVGNLFWIYAISTSPSVSHVRTLMAGIETILLVLAGIYIFNNSENVIRPLYITGIIMIIVGVMFVSF